MMSATFIFIKSNDQSKCFSTIFVFNLVPPFLLYTCFGFPLLAAENATNWQLLIWPQPAVADLTKCELIWPRSCPSPPSHWKLTLILPLKISFTHLCTQFAQPKVTWIKRVFNHSWISIKSAHLRSLRVRQEICWFRQFAGEVFAREDMGNLADLRWRGHGASQCQIQIRMHKYRKDMGNSVDLTGGGGMRMQKQIASDPEKNQSSPILLQIKCHRHSTCCLASWWKTWLWTLGQRDEFLEACAIFNVMSWGCQFFVDSSCLVNC